MPHETRHPPLVILLVTVFLLPALSCSTLPEPRWDPSQLARAVILPVEVAVYRYPGYSYDEPRSSRVSLAVGEAAAAVWKKKGYEVTGPAEAGKTISADPALEQALLSLRKVARSLQAGQGQVNADGERLASAFSAHLVVLAWGTAEYHENMFAWRLPCRWKRRMIGSPGSGGT